MAEITLTKENFKEEVLSSDKTVLVDFWAPWCGPCRMVAPVVAEVAEAHEGTLTVGKVNVDDEPELAMEYGINSIPSLLVFKGGDVVNRSVGAKPRAAIEALLK